MIWVAGLAAGVCVWLLLPAGPDGTVRGRARQERTTALVRAGLVPVGVAAPAVGALAALLDGTDLSLALILVSAAAGAWWLAEVGRRARAASSRAARVVEICEALAGELRAGLPPTTALLRCAESWPELGPVATAAQLGSDVPQALRRAGQARGGSGLTELAAAWKVSEVTGGSMAAALAQTAERARRRRATEQLVASELASARATARLVAVLPIVVLGAGSGLGGDPWGFLVDTTAGLVCLAAGLFLTLTGLGWLERIALGVLEP